MKFKAGKYVICDLCYVVPNEYWDELCKQWFPNTGDNRTNKQIVSYFDEFLDKNVECYALGTANGDGCFQDNFQNQYPVDAGIIGIIKFDDVQTHLSIDENVFDFKDDFEVYDDDGILNFGNIIIDTNFEDEDNF